MKMLSSLIPALTCIALLPCVAQNPKLDVNDVSFLWPVPGSSSLGTDKYISLKDKDAKNEDLMSDELFGQLMQRAKTMGVEGNKIGFPPGVAQDKSRWKVAAIRVNPSSVGPNPKMVEAAGEIPSLRLIVQPVSGTGAQATALDYAVHVPFLFVAGKNDKGAFIPNKTAFDALVRELVAIKEELKQRGVDSQGKPLDVHPGFLAPANPADLTTRLRTLLKNHLRKDQLIAISFMGIPANAPEPWIFFSSGVLSKDGKQTIGPRNVAGNFTDPGTPQGPPAQMLFFLDPRRMIPAPTPAMDAVAKGFGISTAPLFGGDMSAILDQPIFKDVPSNEQAPMLAALHRDIPDIIAHPLFHSTLNTDCASCHSETTRRARFPAGTPAWPKAFKKADEIAGLNEQRLPRDQWNVRIFGWGVPRSGPPALTITRRAFNEAADSAHFINETYLKSSSPAAAQPAPPPDTSPK